MILGGDIWVYLNVMRLNSISLFLFVKVKGINSAGANSDSGQPSHHEVLPNEPDGAGAEHRPRRKVYRPARHNI